MSRTNRWSRVLPPLRSLFGKERHKQRVREATLNVEPLEPRQVFDTSVTLGTLATITEQTSTLIASGATVADDDGDDIASMIVRLGGPQDAGETLTFDAATLVTGQTWSWDAGTRELVISGSATALEYTAILNSVEYESPVDDPATGSRTLTVEVADVTSATGSDSGSFSVTPVNDPPAIAAAASPFSVNEDQTLSFGAGDLVITDPDAGTKTMRLTITVSKASIALTTLPSGVTLDPASDGDTIILEAELDKLNEALAELEFTPAANQNGSGFSIGFEINDDVGDPGANVVNSSASVSVTAVNDAPTLGGTTSSVSYTEQAATSVAVAPGLTIADVENDAPASAKVWISSGFVAGDDLAVTAALPSTSWSWGYVTTTGVLTISAATGATLDEMRDLLRSVVFSSTSDDPGATREVSFEVTDAGGTPATSVPAVQPIAVTEVKDAPVLSGVETTALEYEENDPATVISATITLTDPDVSVYASATVAITSGHDDSEDVLSLDTTLLASLTGWSYAFSSSSGVLTITTGSGANATAANLQALLRTVTYQNTSNDPDDDDRVISFTVQEAAGGPASNTVTRTIEIEAVSDKPVIGGLSSTTYVFTEGGTAVEIAPALTLTDVDDGTVDFATVTITTNRQSTDVLAVSGLPDATWSQSYNSSTGELLINAPTGTTMAEMQAVLRDVVFSNTDQDPSTLTRTIEFCVTEEGTGVSSDHVSVTATVSPVSDAPVLSGVESTALEYDEGDSPTVVSATISLSDPDVSVYASATVAITSGYESGADELAVTGLPTGWNASFNASTGVLTITTGSGANATLANMQDVLRSVTFENDSQNPSEVDREISFTVFEAAGGPSSNTVTRTIEVDASGDAPTLSAPTLSITYVENELPKAVAPAIEVDDVDGDLLASATVKITSGYVSGQDVLAVGTLPFVGTAPFNAATGELTITATLGATAAQMQAALRAVTFANSSNDPTAGARTIEFQVTEVDGALDPDDGLSSTPLTVTVTVVAENDAPTLSGLSSTALAYTEGDGAKSVAGAIVVSDAEDDPVGSATVTITAGFQTGADVLAVTGLPLGWSQSQVGNVLTITAASGATMAQMQTVLRTLSYENTSQNPSTTTRTLSITVKEYDDPLVTTDGLSSNTVTRNVTVTAVNDAPTLDVNSGPTVAEDGVVTIDEAYLSASDPEQSAASIRYTLTGDVGKGALYLSGSKLAKNDTFTQADIDAGRLTYDHNGSNSTSDSFKFTITDGIAAASAEFTHTITIADVNDAPVIAGTGATPTYTEGDTTGVVIDSTITVTDEENTSIATATVSITGNFQSGDYLSATVPGTWSQNYNATTGVLTITAASGATPADMQAVLQTVRFRHATDDPSALARTITFSVTEAGTTPLSSNTLTRTVNVTAVNDPPSVSFTGSFTLSEDSSYTFGAGAITIADPDARTGELEVTIAVDDGALSVVGSLPGGVTLVDGDGSDGTLTWKGTLADLNTALGLLKYTPDANFYGTDDLTVTVSDGGNTGGGVLSDTDVATITVNGVNDKPTVSGATTASVNEDVPLSFTGGAAISINDIDAESGNLTLGLSVNQGGSLTLGTTTGLSGDLVGSDGTLTLTGTLSALQAALATLQYQGATNFNGLETLTVTLSDGGNTGSGGTLTADPFAVVITVNAVNDAPTVSGPASVSLNEDASIAFTGGNTISVSDVDFASNSPTNKVTVTVSVTTGQFSIDLTGLSGSDLNPSDGSVTFEGTVDEVNAALATLEYWMAANVNGSAVLTVTVADQGNVGIGGALSATRNVAITVDPVNDAPTLSAPGAISVNEDTDYDFAPGDITVGDIDYDETVGGVIRVELSVSDGALSLVGTAPLGLVQVDADGSDGTLIWEGTVAALNAALGQLRYRGDLNFNGSDSLGVFVSDLGNTGPGAPLTALGTVLITVNPANDKPVVDLNGAAAGSATATALEQTQTAVVPNATINDVDSSTLSAMTITLTNVIDSGAESIALLNNGSALGLNYNVDDYGGTIVITIDGTATVAQYEAILRSLVYENSSENPNETARLITVVVYDDVNAASDVQTVSVAVEKVNDAPTIVAPPSVPVNEDQPVTFDGLYGITIDDVDATAAGQLSVKLSVSNGTLALGSTAGLSGDFDGSDGEITITGTLADLNLAIKTLVYQGDPDFNTDHLGSENLVIEVDDLGNTDHAPATAETATATVPISVSAVNDGPEITAPVAGVQTNEDSSLSFTGSNAISISDDATDAGETISVVLKVVNGVITIGTASGLTGDFDGSDGQLTLVGTVGDVNAALATLVYTPDADFNGSDSLSISVDDLGHTGSGGSLTDAATVPITVNAVNDAPEITAPTSVMTGEDGALAFGANAISIYDRDAGSGNLTVVLSVASGSLSVTNTSGLDGSSDLDGSDGTITLTGSQSAINDALDSLVYTPDADFNGSDSLSISVDDLNNVGLGGPRTDTATVAINVLAINDAPEITAPASDATDEDAPLTFNAANGNAITIADRDAGSGLLTLTLQVANGALTLGGTSGLTGDLDGSDGTISVTGTLADLQAALDGLVYTPDLDFNGTDSLFIVLNDGGNTGFGGAMNDFATVTLTVAALNDAPQIGVPSNPSTNEDVPLVFSSGSGNAITIADPDSGESGATSPNLTVTLTAAHGVLTAVTGTGASLSGNGTAALVITGTREQINDALDGLTFTPDADFNDLLGTAQIQIHVTDHGNVGVGGELTDSETLSISVVAQNDAPVLTAPTSASTQEDVPVAIPTISVADVDASESGASPQVVVTLVATFGTLNLGGGTFTASVAGEFTSTLTISGTVADVNAALAALVFSPAADFNSTLGAATISVEVDDQGNSGAGGALTDAAVITVNVSAVNDAPTITAPASVSTSEDAGVSIPGVSIADVDAADPGATNPYVVVVVTATNGTVSVGAGPFAAVVENNGTGVLTIKGNLIDVNAALSVLAFTPDEDFNDFRAVDLGAANVRIEISDRGNVGSGGVLTAVHDVAVSVTPVNDPPTISTPAPVTTNEDTPVAVVGFVVGDDDAYELGATTEVRVTLSSLHGVMTIDGSGGATVSNSGTSLVVIEGTVAQVNAALATLVFSPDADFNDNISAARIDAVVSDLGNSSLDPTDVRTAASSVNISVTPVNDAPTVSAPTDVYATEDVTFPFTLGNHVSIADVDVNELGAAPLTVTLQIANGVLNATAVGGAVVSGAGGSTLTITGLLADINATLLTLAFTPDADFNDNLADTYLDVTVDDGGNVGSGGSQYAYASVRVHVAAVNDPPVIAAPTTASTNEDVPVTITGVSITDVDAEEAGYVAPQMTVTITAVNGVVNLYQLASLISSGQITIDAGADGSAMITISGALDAINLALSQLKFSPDANFNDNLGDAFVLIDACDNGNVGSGVIGNAATQRIDVAVAPQNDSPTITAPTTISTDEDVAIQFISSGVAQILVEDVDAAELGATTQLSVSLTAVQGVLTLGSTPGGLSITGNGTASITLSGTLASIQAALEGLLFEPTADYSGSASITISVDDLGNTGAGGAKTASHTIFITVVAVADEPTVAVAESISGTEGVWLDASIDVNLTDLDGSESLTVVITGLPGNATLSIGTKNLDGSWTIEQADYPSLAAFIAALDGLKVKVTDQNDEFGAPITGRSVVVKAISTEASNGDSAETDDGFVLTISNAPPVQTAPTVLTGGTLVSGTHYKADEGTFVSFNGSFTDLGIDDLHTVEIDWGDGTGRQAVSVSRGATNDATGRTSTFSAGHVYTNEGATVFTITVYVRDEVSTDDDADLQAFTVTVNNVPPTLPGAADALYVDEQQPLKVSLPFSDPGILDTFTVVVNFGDSTGRRFNNGDLVITPGTNTGTGVIPTAGSIPINKKYLFPGTYTMTVAIFDDGMSESEATVTTFVVIVVDIPGVGLELPDPPETPPLLLPPVSLTTTVPLLQTVPSNALVGLGSSGGQGGATTTQQNEVPTTLKIQVVVEKISRFRGKSLGVEFTDILFANQINLVLERVGKLTPGVYRVTLSAAGMPALVHEFSIAATDGNAAQRGVRTLWQEVQSREQSGGQNRGFQFLDQSQSAEAEGVPVDPNAAPQRSADAGAPAVPGGAPTGDSVSVESAAPDVRGAIPVEAPLPPAAAIRTPDRESSPGDVAAGAAVGLLAASALAGRRKRPSVFERLLSSFRGRGE